MEGPSAISSAVFCDTELMWGHHYRTIWARGSSLLRKDGEYRQDGSISNDASNMNTAPAKQRSPQM